MLLVNYTSGRDNSICLPWKLELAVVGSLATHRGQDLAIDVENLRKEGPGQINCERIWAVSIF